MPKAINIPPLRMHLYTCLSCSVDFGVEDREDTDHSDAVCPLCQCNNLSDAGYGLFLFMQIPESEATKDAK